MADRGRWALAALWSVRGIGAKSLKRLRAVAPVSAWFDLPFSDVLKHLAAGEETTMLLESAGSLQAIARTLRESVARAGQRLCFRGDDQYPKLLSTVDGAPPVLFFKGPGAVAEPRAHIAIVGARKSSEEWRAFTKALANDAVAQGLVVISGGAEGIDTAAHDGALEAKGVTWAFMASGLDQLDAPPRAVAERVLAKGGTIFSEYPPGARPESGLFVRRNRLVSGSADVVVVVRGDEKSGTRHTAESAIAQGRVLLAVPSEPRDQGNAVCRKLLREGARPCFDISDVMRGLGLVPMAPVREPVVSRGEVSGDAKCVFDALPTGVFDLERALVSVPERPSGDVASALMELEIAGWLVTRTGRRYEKRE